MAAHRGITVADVPNLFFLLGPNTGLGHNSVVFMIESQIRYVAARDRRGRTRRARRRWRPTRAAQDGTTTSCSTTWPARCGTPVVAAAGTWTSTASTGRCGAGLTWQYWLATRRFKPSEYTVLRGRSDKPALAVAIARDTPTHDVVLPAIVAPQG